MNSWYSKNLGDAMLTQVKLEQIKATFLAEYNHNNAAVFFRHESEGKLHCDIIIYFTSSVERMAKIFDAKPCDKLNPIGLDLLVGSFDIKNV